MTFDTIKELNQVFFHEPIIQYLQHVINDLTKKLDRANTPDMIKTVFLIFCKTRLRDNLHVLCIELLNIVNASSSEANLYFEGVDRAFNLPRESSKMTCLHGLYTLARDTNFSKQIESFNSFVKENFTKLQNLEYVS